MSRPLALLFAVFLIAAADSGPLPHASGRPDGPGPGCGGGFTAARGDTLYSIARRCETSVAELVQENRLGSPQGLEPGQRLAIPGFDVPVVRPHGPPGPDWSQILPPPPSAVRPLPRPASPPERGPPPHGDLYHVQAGDTLYSLARWARTSLAALRAANPDVDPRDVEIGDPIRLPRGAVRPEPLRLRERGRPPTAAVAAPPSPPPPPAARPPRPPVSLPPPPPEADKPADVEDEDEDDEGVTPGGMDDGEPEPDGM